MNNGECRAKVILGKYGGWIMIIIGTLCFNLMMALDPERDMVLFRSGFFLLGMMWIGRDCL